MPYQPSITLDGRPVEKITAFLFPKGGNDDPHILLANQGKSFQGSIVLGMGFTFDDSNADATPIAEMHRLIETDPRNSERIFPYIGGDEVNNSPTHSHHRYVINFGEMSEVEAREWPDLIDIVEWKVKPDRAKQNQKTADGRRRATRWWLWGRYTPALFKAVETCDRVLVIPSSATKYLNFAFLPSDMVFSHKLIVFPLQNFAHFASLQSQTHLYWTKLCSATMKDDLTYNPSDCFTTFPFPINWETDPILETIGKTYYEFRADLLVRNNEGLTDTFNRFHDPRETNLDFLKLRDLHQQMDRAILNAYGWNDIDTTCGFALDYIDIEEDKLPSATQERLANGDFYFPTAEEAASFDSLFTGLVRKRKKRENESNLNWRYRWHETAHDEVLARLLDLNQKRHEEEVRGQVKSEKQGNGSRKPSQQSHKTNGPQQLNLI